MHTRPQNESSSLFPSAGKVIAVVLLLICTQIPLLPAEHGLPDVTGVWDLTVETQTGTAHPSITLKQDGEKITGTYRGRMGDAKLQGTLKGEEIHFTVTLKFQEASIAVTYDGTVSGDAMRGTARFADSGTGKWSAKRR